MRKTTSTDAPSPSRQIASDVLFEALGSSVTPFVPVPFVDDWLVARLLRRIAKKVLVRRGIEPSKPLVGALVDGFVGTSTVPLAQRAAVGAVRFVVRKVAVVLDVKKSHDVFGEAIAFAFALDAAIGCGALHGASAVAVGRALHRAVGSVGSGALETLAGAVRATFVAQPAEQGGAQAARAARIAEAVGAQVDEAHARIDEAVRREIAGR